MILFFPSKSMMKAHLGRIGQNLQITTTILCKRNDVTCWRAWLNQNASPKVFSQNLHTITLSVRTPSGAETNATAIAEPTVWSNYARRKLKSPRKKIDHVQAGNDRETIRKIFLTFSCVVCMVFTQSLPPAPTQSTSTGNVRRCTTLILWICDAGEGSGTKQNSAVGKNNEPK